jgi:hypothetical protein
MKKYVICHEEECLFICKTRADAEEIILSLAEESVYENWYVDNCADAWGNTSYSTPFKYIFRNGENYRKMSAWAWALYSFSSAYWIDEVEELE